MRMLRCLRLRLLRRAVPSGARGSGMSADRRIRFVFGPDRAKFVGVNDWEQVSDAITFHPTSQQSIEDACWPILDVLDSASAAECKAAVTALLDGAVL